MNMANMSFESDAPYRQWIDKASNIKLPDRTGKTVRILILYWSPTRRQQVTAFTMYTCNRKRCRPNGIP